MKMISFQKLCVMLVLAVVAVCNTVEAKTKQKVADKELIGVWIMESYCYEGEDKVECGKNYSQVKVYRANGEYACAEVARLRNGQVTIVPHEYGTYSFKDGNYVEMGRENSNLNLVDANTFTGQWKNRHDVWKKSTDMPKELEDYIVNKCKANQMPDANVQKLIKTYILFNAN